MSILHCSRPCNFFTNRLWTYIRVDDTGQVSHTIPTFLFTALVQNHVISWTDNCKTIWSAYSLLQTKFQCQKFIYHNVTPLLKILQKKKKERKNSFKSVLLCMAYLDLPIWIQSTFSDQSQVTSQIMLPTLHIQRQTKLDRRLNPEFTYLHAFACNILV